MVFNRLLPNDRDLLFEPNYYLNLGYAGRVFIYVVDASLGKVYLRNDTDTDVVILRKARLGTIKELNYDGYYIIDPYNAGLTATG